MSQALMLHRPYWTMMVRALTGVPVQEDNSGRFAASYFTADPSPKITWLPNHCVGVLLHEAGHALDPETHEIARNLPCAWTDYDPDTVLRIEEKAWRIAAYLAQAFWPQLNDEIESWRIYGLEWYKRRLPHPPIPLLGVRWWAQERVKELRP